MYNPTLCGTSLLAGRSSNWLVVVDTRSVGITIPLWFSSRQFLFGYTVMSESYFILAFLSTEPRKKSLLKKKKIPTIEKKKV